MNMMTAERLYEFRRANHLSQEELAEKLGVSRQAVSKWERGESSPDTDNLIALARLYKISIDELINGSSAPTQSESQPSEEQSNGDTAAPEFNAPNDSAPSFNTPSGTYYTPAVEAVKPKKRSKALIIILAIICAITIIFVASIACVFRFATGIVSGGVAESIVGSVIENIPNWIDDDIAYDDTSYLTGSGEVDASTVQEIDIEWIAGNINIEYYDGDTISFTESGYSDDKFAMHYKVQNGILDLRFTASGISLRKSDIKKDLTVLIPNGKSLAKLDIEAVSSDVNVADIVANELDIETVSGNSTTTGSFTVADLTSVSGSINLTLPTSFTKLDIETVLGNSTVYLPQDSSFRLNMDTVSGTIYASDFGAEGKIKNFTFGNGDALIDAESVSGDISIKAIN